MLDEKTLGFVNLLATVNVSRSKIWQKIPTLIRLLAAAGVVIHLSWTLEERCRSPNVELGCHGVARDFFAAGIGKLITFAVSDNENAHDQMNE